MNNATRTPEQEYRELYEKMAQLCDQQGWGDPFSYARSKEIYAATVLGHQVAKDFSGADAIDNGEEVEYKSLEEINEEYRQKKRKERKKKKGGFETDGFRGKKKKKDGFDLGFD